MRNGAARRKQEDIGDDDRARRDVERAESIGETFFESAAVDPRKEYYDELAAYLAPFRRFPTLKKDEDIAFLFDMYATGTEIERLRSRDLIVYGNVKLILSVALRCTGRGLPLLDMLQEGAFGLMRAIEKYEIEKGFRFSTYAHSWIRQAISRALCDQSEKTVYRIPVHYQELLQLTRRICGELYLETGRWPKEVAVYERMKAHNSQAAQKVSLGDVVRLVRMIQEGKLVHLDAPVADGSDDTIADTLNLGPPKTETIVEARRLHAEYQQAIERITSAVDELPPRKAMIVRLRLGLGEFEAMTLEEIGARYELTRERIRQIEADAYKELELKLGITPAEIEEIVDVAQDLEVVANAI